jgi:O-acetyl-ADP-ribose deacetylase (regulator of RNase III)
VGEAVLHGFTDADYISCTNTQRSVGAYLFKPAFGPTLWCSKQPPTDFDSTTKAKYKALSEAAKKEFTFVISLTNFHSCHCYGYPFPAVIKAMIKQCIPNSKMHIYPMQQTCISPATTKVPFYWPRTPYFMPKPSTLGPSTTSIESRC